MSMITEQVERLRTLADITKDIADNSTDTVKTLREAADTIEQLAAIKTLEQEPCDVFDEYGNYKYPSDVELTEPNTATSMPCEDAVSRQAVLEQINYWAISNREYLPTNAMHYLTRRIQDMPPVNPQPKTGHWIAEVDKWGDIVTTVSGYKCSECGEFDSFRDKFCPNCGCRMVEPQESEGTDADNQT